MAPGTRPPPEPADDETELERWRRNFAELLQELRVAQTGVQIMFAFLLVLAFTPGFEVDRPFTRTVYLVALLSTAAATALIIGPVAQHRILFRRRQKPALVVWTHRMAMAGLSLVIVSMVSTVLLAADRVLGRAAALAVAAGTGVWFLLLWVVIPWLNRRS
jgi:hypothetical protein